MGLSSHFSRVQTQLRDRWIVWSRTFNFLRSRRTVFQSSRASASPPAESLLFRVPASTWRRHRCAFEPFRRARSGISRSLVSLMVIAGEHFPGALFAIFVSSLKCLVLSSVSSGYGFFVGLVICGVFSQSVVCFVTSLVVWLLLLLF